MRANSKLLAGDYSMRTYTGKKCGFGASAPSLTRASPMHFFLAREGLIMLLKLIKLVGPSSTGAEEISPCFSPFFCNTLRTFASLRVYFYVCLCFVARRSRRAWYSSPARCWFILSIIPANVSQQYVSVPANRSFNSRYNSAIVGSPGLNS